MSQLTAHFTTSEFECKCGCGKLIIDEDFVKQLELARMFTDVPFEITSGYRCKEHNEEVGGVADSAHTKGKAADIKAIGSVTRYSILEAVIVRGFKRIGIGKTFIHVDVDTSKPAEVMWLY
jgi:zinc D-Ala-D-Ala carboxypeptidase